MSPITQQILSQALQLPEQDREFLADSLWGSVHAEGPVEEKEWTRQWGDEAERRCKEVDDGKMKLIPHEEVMANLRARFQR